jgi:xanthine dehydrogenase YagS FAD-binding subunit
MEPFKMFKAHDAASAVNGVLPAGSKFIAGGTNLIDLMKLNIETPARLVDINRLGMDKIEHLSNGNLRIGALVKNSDLAYNPVIQKNYPVLSEALLSGASAQLRNMATVAGNIMQRVRCPYFYNTEFACNKRVPGSGCSALNGYNRNHAILGTSDFCIAAHPSDMSVPMVALDAVINVQGQKGNRSIRFQDFHLLPGKTPHIEHALKHDELITSVDIPPLPYASRSHYLKVRDRASFEFALTSAAVLLDIQNGRIANSRIAFGGIGTKPWRSTLAEKALQGAPANEQTYRTAAEAALSEAKPYRYNGFKIELAKRTLVKALLKVGGMS